MSDTRWIPAVIDPCLSMDCASCSFPYSHLAALLYLACRSPHHCVLTVECFVLSIRKVLTAAVLDARTCLQEKPSLTIHPNKDLGG